MNTSNAANSTYRLASSLLSSASEISGVVVGTVSSAAGVTAGTISSAVTSSAKGIVGIIFPPLSEDQQALLHEVELYIRHLNARATPVEMGSLTPRDESMLTFISFDEALSVIQAAIAQKHLDRFTVLKNTVEKRDTNEIIFQLIADIRDNFPDFNVENIYKTEIDISEDVQYATQPINSEMVIDSLKKTYNELVGTHEQSLINQLQNLFNKASTYTHQKNIAETIRAVRYTANSILESIDPEIGTPYRVDDYKASASVLSDKIGSLANARHKVGIDLIENNNNDDGDNNDGIISLIHSNFTPEDKLYDHAQYLKDPVITFNDYDIQSCLEKTSILKIKSFISPAFRKRPNACGVEHPNDEHDDTEHRTIHDTININELTDRYKINRNNINDFEDLEGLLKKIIGNQSYWESKVHYTFKKVPDGIKAMQKLTEENINIDSMANIANQRTKGMMYLLFRVDNRDVSTQCFYNICKLASGIMSTNNQPGINRVLSSSAMNTFIADYNHFVDKQEKNGKPRLELS